MDKGIDYMEIFMPEGQCARCGAVPPAFASPFALLSGGNINLGFCSKKCLNYFVQGIEAVNHAAEKI